jgi:hypothetical protein
MDGTFEWGVLILKRNVGSGVIRDRSIEILEDDGDGGGRDELDCVVCK